MPFSQLPASLGEALTAHGYTAFTAVQHAVLEPQALGRDLLVSAQTGSGKTVAFGLAFANELLGKEGQLGHTNAPLALVIAPTRELALQVQRELTWLYAPAGAQVAACVGGMDVRQEQRQLAQGPHIVVGTPGRLCDHLERGTLNIHKLRAVVLDEADEMLDMGFREALEEILDATPTTRRTLLFSATIAKPIAALAQRYQRDALRIATTNAERGHGDISYQALAVAPADVEHALVNLLRFHEPDIAMVFCATRNNVRRLHANLVERGFAAVALSGEHSQTERNLAMQSLRDRRARVCVATDVAARGIDLPDLSLVIHAELPRDGETLQHRSGRTGRAGKKGIAALIVPFPRRRVAEGMFRAAQITVAWVAAPTPEDIRTRDSERLLDKLLLPQTHPDEADRALAHKLLAERSPEEVALALVRLHRGRLPEPEELIEVGTRGGPSRDAPPEARDEASFEDAVWFKMNIGRHQRADPKWLLPLLCRSGHLVKSEIGVIRIGANETRFQIPRLAAKKFREALKRSLAENPESDAGVKIEPADGPPSPERRSSKSNFVKAKPRRAPDGKPRPERFQSAKPKRGGGRPPR